MLGDEKMSVAVSSMSVADSSVYSTEEQILPAQSAKELHVH